MLDHDSAVAPQDSCHDGPLRAYERYRTKDPAEASGLSAAVLSANQLVVRDHDHRFEATCRAVRVHSASLLYMTYGTDVVVDRLRPPRRDYLAILLPVYGQLRLRHQGREFDIVAGETAGVTCSRDALHAQFGGQASVLTLCVLTCTRSSSRSGTCSWNRRPQTCASSQARSLARLAGR